MGHVVVMDDSDAQFALTRYSRELWAALGPELPESAEYNPCGTLWVAADEEEMREVSRKHRYYSERGLRVEVLDSGQVREAEPKLRAGLAGALFVLGDIVIDPPSVTAYLLREPGIRLQSGKVSAIAEGKLQMEGGSRVTAGAIVNAAGVAASRLTPQIPITIKPRKGHLLMTGSYPGFLRRQTVELGYVKSAHATTADSVVFNVQPRRSGQITIGASRQFGAQDAGIDQTVLSAMLRRACEYMPDLASLSAARSWTGFRPATADHLPLIGPCPGYRDVYIAAGHEGLGITASVGTGQLICDLILRRETAIPCKPYSPARTL